MRSADLANGALCDGIHRQDDPQPCPRRISYSRASWDLCKENLNSLLMVEYAGETEDEVKAQVPNLKNFARQAHRLCRDPSVQARRGQSDLGSSQSRARFTARHQR